MNDTKLDRVFGRNYKILKLFLVEPEREFYVTEAAEILNMNKMSILRALEGMVKARLMKSRFDNYRKFYKLRDSPMIKLLKILGNLDSLLVSEFLKKFESKSELIMLFGSRADGTDVEDSDWDFIMVSNELDVVAVNRTISEMEARFGVQINVKLYTSAEYMELTEKKTPFYREVMTNNVILGGQLLES
jgi:predicted nucleotidyltransferase